MVLGCGSGVLGCGSGVLGCARGRDIYTLFYEETQIIYIFGGK